MTRTSIKNRKLTSVFLVFFCLFVFNLPLLFACAADYQLLEPSVIINNNSGGTQPSQYTLREYIKTAYFVFFVIVLSFAVFFFIIGGLQYVISDLPMVKAGGLKQIQNSLIGIAIALSSYLLLRLINPDLINLNFNFTL